jgi:hypothetical protein
MHLFPQSIINTLKSVNSLSFKDKIVTVIPISTKLLSQSTFLISVFFQNCNWFDVTIQIGHLKGTHNKFLILCQKKI